MRIYSVYAHRDGWIRLGRCGWGIAWKPASAPLLFSERHGYTRSLCVVGWRLKFLPRVK